MLSLFGIVLTFAPTRPTADGSEVLTIVLGAASRRPASCLSHGLGLLSRFALNLDGGVWSNALFRSVLVAVLGLDGSLWNRCFVGSSMRAWLGWSTRSGSFPSSWFSRFSSVGDENQQDLGLKSYASQYVG